VGLANGLENIACDTAIGENVRRGETAATTVTSSARPSGMAQWRHATHSLP
jgi:hypothetical protein